MAPSPLTKAAVGIVGAGPIAQALGHLLRMGGAPVTALANRSSAQAQAAAAFIGPGVRVVPIAQLPTLASRVLIAVADDAISAAADALAEAHFQGVALHTCGARGPEELAALQRVGASCGVLHPLQSVVTPAGGVEALRGIAFAVAGDEPARAWGAEIVEYLSGTILSIAPGRQALYHAGAVMAGNAVMAIVDAAVRLMSEAGIDQRAALAAIAPLCRTSLANTLRVGPEWALTGPVARGDLGTIRRHVEALAQAQGAASDLYVSVSVCLVDLARRRGMSPERLREMMTILQELQGGAHNGVQTDSHR